MKLPSKDGGFPLLSWFTRGYSWGELACSISGIQLVRRTIGLHFGSHSQGMASCEIEVDGGFNVKHFPLLGGPHPGWVLLFCHSTELHTRPQEHTHAGPDDVMKA